MVYDALRTIMPIAGWPEERAREVEISVGADPVLPIRFCIGPAGAAPRGPSDFRAGQHTSIIEPLSLDEAYLDVTENLKAISSATQILSPFAMSPKSSLGPSAAHSYKGSGLAKLTLLSVASAAGLAVSC
jgi:hypothetical protein